MYGPEFHNWVSVTSKYRSKPSISANADSTEIWEVEQQTRIRQNAVATALRKQEQDLQRYKRDVELVHEWETRRQNYPLPLPYHPRSVSEARLSIVLRRTEIEQTQAVIAAQHLSPEVLLTTIAENFRREKLAKELLEDAVRSYEQGNTMDAFNYCVGVLDLTRERSPVERFLKARAHAILGVLGVLRCRDHLQAAIDIYRSFEVLQLPGIDGSWRKWISEAQSVLDKNDETQTNLVQQDFDMEWAITENALNAIWINDQDEAAGLCAGLLRSKFVAIRAQAHLLLARLDKTPDKIQHARNAQSRLQTLAKECPGVMNWEYMMRAVDWVLNPPPPRFRLNDLHDLAQQQWLDKATQLLAGLKLAGVNGSRQEEAMRICLTLTGSAYLAIRAQSHHYLATMDWAGDELFRRLEAFQALHDLQICQQLYPNIPMWLEMIGILENGLGGPSRAEWEAAAVHAGNRRNLGQVEMNFARLGRT